MSRMNFRYTRRGFVTAAAAAAGAAAVPLSAPRAATKWRRYNVTSPEGQKMLVSYAKGVEAMLKLPADHPQNWFRNAFIHLMDCPHGNWWFYVWHRGYLGYFERSIRNLSGDPDFALPYWDWTELPQIPDGMFDGVLTPTGKAFAPYTGNLALFTSFVQNPLSAYWNGLSAPQKAQQGARGYKAFTDLWNDVTGYSAATQGGISGNEAFAITCGSRYLSRDNPKLDPATAYNVSPFVVLSGLLPTDFNNPVNTISFTSSKAPTHNWMGAVKFSTLEGMPHNQVHNYIGGVGPLDPGPYGNMTNFLSPIDPIFFLHHSNMDRLWDVWTRKQQRLGLPFLPVGDDLKAFANEPFLFYVGGDGKYVGPSKAGDYLSTEAFDYDYQPGFGEDVVQTPTAVAAARKPAPYTGTPTATGAQVTVAKEALQRHLAESGGRPLVAAITVPRPAGTSSTRSFDVLVNAPAGQAGAGNPGFAGTISFFGAMMPGMKMEADATFAVPLPKAQGPLLGAAPANAANATLNIRVVPANGRQGTASAVKAVTVNAL